MLEVEGVGSLGAGADPLAVAPQLGVLAPQIVPVRPLVDELRPLALPRGMTIPVEEPVGEIVGLDYRDRAEAGDPRTGAGEPEDGTRQDLLAGGDLRGAGRRLVGLRIIHKHQRRPDAAAVRLGVLDAADAAGDPSDADRGPGRRVAVDPRHCEPIVLPLDPRWLPLVGLPLRSLADPVEGADREARGREVLEEQIVRLDLGFDRFQHRLCDAAVRSDEHRKRTMAVDEAPEACPLGEGRLARAARHRVGEQLAAEDRGFDLGDRGQVIRRPSERERFSPVRLAELPETLAAIVTAGDVDDGWQIADVAACGRLA